MWSSISLQFKFNKTCTHAGEKSYVKCVEFNIKDTWERKFIHVKYVVQHFQRVSFKTHMRTHTAENPCMCKVYRLAFLYNALLKTNANAY